jgi:hypothetical protein
MIARRPRFDRNPQEGKTMKTFGALAAFVVVTSASAQGAPGYDKVFKAVCEKGNPWRMPVPTAVDLKEMETPIKLYGTDGKAVLICNCTADRAGKNTGVDVESDDFSERAAAFKARRGVPQATGASKPRFVHYLPSGSCTTAASGTVALKPGDKTVETWGTFEAFESK